MTEGEWVERYEVRRELQSLFDLLALGRCWYCGTLGGIWHKLGCPNDR